MPGDDLTADDAWSLLRSTGWWHLVRDSFLRMRDADGSAYARAVGFQVSLAIIPLAVALLGLSKKVGGEPGRVLDLTVRGVTPGASDRLLDEAASGGNGSGTIAIALGLAGCVLALTGAMAEIERGANRIYGSQVDRTTWPRYQRAAVLALLAGVPSLLGWFLMVGGAAVGEALHGVYGWGAAAEEAWDVGRWPAGMLLAVAGFAVVFERAPRRRQPTVQWLAFGGAVTVLLWAAFTVLMAVYVERSSVLGETYGPLAGVLALLLWAYGSSVAVFWGLAFAAQMEALHVGRTALPSPGAP